MERECSKPDERHRWWAGISAFGIHILGSSIFLTIVLICRHLIPDYYDHQLPR